MKKLNVQLLLGYIQNLIKNGNFKFPIADLRLSKDKIETIKDLLTGVIGKGKLDALALM